MNLLAASPAWLTGLLIALLTTAMVQDAVQLRIANALAVAVLALAVFAVAISGFEQGVWQNGIVFSVVLAIGALLFSRELLGGGDVKLLAAVAAWTDVRSAPLLIAAILICGGLVALAILFLRTVVPDRFSRRVMTLRAGAGIPYGIAISVGTLLAMALSRPG